MGNGARKEKELIKQGELGKGRRREDKCWEEDWGRSRYQTVSYLRARTMINSLRERVLTI